MNKNIKSSYCSNSQSISMISCPFLLAQAGTFPVGVAVTSQILCISITLNKKIQPTYEIEKYYAY